jgi:hypothetical protein
VNLEPPVRKAFRTGSNYRTRVFFIKQHGAEVNLPIATIFEKIARSFQQTW